MKVINIPGLCAIPRIYNAIGELFTPDPVDEKTKEKDPQVDVLLNRIHDLEDELASDTKPMATNEQTEDVKQILEDTIDYLKTGPGKRKFAEPKITKAPSSVGDGVWEERLQNDLSLKLENTPGALSTEPTRKKRKDAKRSVPYKKDTTPLYQSEWDLIHLRNKQRIAWNKAHPKLPSYTKEDMYKELNYEMGSNRKTTFFSNVLTTTSKYHRPREAFKPAPVGHRKYTKKPTTQK